LHPSISAEVIVVVFVVVRIRNKTSGAISALFKAEIVGKEILIKFFKEIVTLSIHKCKFIFGFIFGYDNSI
jgi:hypothetical protein